MKIQGISDIIPDPNGVADLGDSSNRFGDVYMDQAKKISMGRTDQSNTVDITHVNDTNDKGVKISINSTDVLSVNYNTTSTVYDTKVSSNLTLDSGITYNTATTTVVHDYLEKTVGDKAKIKISQVDSSSYAGILYTGDGGFKQYKQSSDNSTYGNLTNQYIRNVGTNKEIFNLDVSSITGAQGSLTDKLWITTNNHGSSNEVRFTFTEEGVLIVPGDLYADSFNINSDDRIKFDETLISNSLHSIMNLSPQTYNKAPSLDQLEDPSVRSFEAGLIAQDIYYDTPEFRHLIIIPSDANPSENKPPTPDDIQDDPDYSDWGTTSTKVNYQGFVPYMIAATQELKQEKDIENTNMNTTISTLQTENQELRTLIENLTTRVAALE